MPYNLKWRYSFLPTLQRLRPWAGPLLALALVVAAAAVYLSASRLVFRTNRSDLVASDQRLIALGQKLDRDFGSRDGLMVVVENGEPRRTIEFAEALAAELRRYPDRFPELFYHQDPAEFKSWALLYLEPQELQQLKENLLAHQPLLARLAAEPRLTQFYQGVNQELTRALLGHLFTDFLKTSPGAENLPDLSLLQATLAQLQRQLEGNQPYVSPFDAFFSGKLADLSAEGYFFTENDKYLLFLVTPKEDGYANAAQHLSLLRQVVARVQARFPGINAGVTGPIALEADEMGSALRDITLATWLSLLGQLLLLIFFLRSLKRTLVQGLVLIIGLCWTFGVVTLVVGHLNLLSMIFAPLMLGLTIDYGIHWFCRLEEEEAQSGLCLETLSCTFRRATPGIIYAGLAAAVSFLPLVFTGFKGLAELGLILTLGILLMLVATLLLLPALVLVTERCPSTPVSGDCTPHPHPFLSLNWTRPGLVVAVGLGLTALGGVSLFKVTFDLNPLHLQNQKTESVVWEYHILKNSQYSTSYGAMATASLAELEARTRALKKLPSVSHVESVQSFLPEQVEIKRSILKELQPVLAQVDLGAAPPTPSSPRELAAILGRIRFKVAQALESVGNPESDAALKPLKEVQHLLGRVLTLLDAEGHPQAGSRLAAFEQRFFADLQEKWDLLRANVAAAPPTSDNLPLTVRQRFISPEGTYLLRVFPSQDIWNLEPLKQFVRDLWSVDPNAVGEPVLLYAFTLGFRNACLGAAGLALGAIIIMLLLFFRSVRLTLLALLPLVVGTGWTLNLMWLLNIPFNQANVLFLPLILGEAVEFGIIILVRWQQEASARAITLPASTAKGVALAALTTTVGFGSLMVSGHRGVFSLGLLATVGSLSVLVASLSVLPAFLRLLERRAEVEQEALSPAPARRRWLPKLFRERQNEKT